MSAAAMLVYPTSSRWRWSESGNHENNIYNNTWSEKNHGIKEVEKDGKMTFEFDIEKNSELAKNLKGHLMLVTGDIDNNVHPANTYRLADALIKANKRFDFFLIPGQAPRLRRRRRTTSTCSAPTTSAATCSARRPTACDITELNRETQQNGEGGGDGRGTDADARAKASGQSATSIPTGSV